MSTVGIETSTNQGTYIIVNDSMIRVKAIDLGGQRINMTASDHLVYQKLRHMHEKLEKAGKPCLPSKRWLSYQLCVSERSVAKSLDVLKKVGLVEWKKTMRHGHVRNVYTVHSELKHKVYVADLKESVLLSLSEEAVRNRVQELCGETFSQAQGVANEQGLSFDNGSSHAAGVLQQSLEEDDDWDF